MTYCAGWKYSNSVYLFADTAATKNLPATTTHSSFGELHAQVRGELSAAIAKLRNGSSPLQPLSLHQAKVRSGRCVVRQPAVCRTAPLYAPGEPNLLFRLRYLIPSDAAAIQRSDGWAESASETGSPLDKGKDRGR